MIEKTLYKNNLFYKITVKSRPKVCIIHYGKIGNKGRTKESTWSAKTAKEVFHQIRDKLLKEGYQDNSKKSLVEKKQWRETKEKQLKKSKKTAQKVYNHNINCPPGQILKQGYVREAYTRKNGTKVAKKVVKPTCIKKRGAKVKYVPPPGKKGIPPLKSGELSKHGYTKVKTLNPGQRKRALKSAVDEYGASMVMKKITALRTLQKRTNPELVEKFGDNLKWIRKTYDDQFKSSWKDSAYFKPGKL